MQQTLDSLAKSIRLLVFFVCAMITQSGFAINDNIRFENLNLDDKVAQQSIISIFQDSKGYMWFGTQDGLNRYDGIYFKAYQHDEDNPHTVSSGWIYSITEDNQGRLWIGTNAGLSVLDAQHKQFTRYGVNDNTYSINDNMVRIVHKAKNGSMWVASSKGLNHHINDKMHFKQYNFSDYLDFESTDIYALVEDKHRSFWLGTKDKGLLRFDPQTGDLSVVAAEFNTEKGLANIGIRSLFIDEEQILWIGSVADGLYRFDLTNYNNNPENIAISPVKQFSPKSIVAIYQDSFNTLWLATGKGLHYKNKNENVFNSMLYHYESGGDLADSLILSLYLDSSGVFWVGSINGLNKWNTRTKQFAHYYKSGAPNKSLSANDINLLGFGGKVLIYVGTSNGMDIINTQSDIIRSLPIETQSEPGLKDKRVMGFTYVNDKELWFGYMTGGVTKYDPTNNTFVHYEHDPSDTNSIVKAGVTAIIHSNNDNLWFSTFGGGLSRYNRSTNNFTNFSHDPADPKSLSSSNILTLVESHDGNIWLGTWGGGLNILNPDTGAVTTVEHSKNDESNLGSNNLVTFLQDAQDNIWIGTYGAGLRMISAENINQDKLVFDKLDSKDGMPNNVVYGLMDDQDGFIWASTNKGIVKINPQTNDLTIFTESQGLQSDEFNSGAVLKDESGYLYFGGMNGLSAFYPPDIKPNPIEPKIQITSFQRLNEFRSVASVINDEGFIEVNYTDYVIGFEFAAMDFASPQNIQYRYKLLGFDQEWMDIRRTPHAIYTNLPSGKYEFQVAATNSDGVWNTKNQSIGLLVHPAPWFSWWAYTVYCVIVFLIFYVFYRSYKRKAWESQKYQIDLQKEVGVRTTELKQANEQLRTVSITDQLTNLHNRRYLTQVMPERIEDIERRFSQAILDETISASGGPRLIVIMFDLDGFKPVNDSYGHEAGDKVIIQVANIIKKECRKHDVVIRWGGDEYMVVAEVDNLDQGCLFAQRIRNAIMRHEFELGLPKKLHLSSSLGFAMYPFYHYAPKAISWEQVQLLADHALYQSKHAGGNIWSGLVQVDKELSLASLNAITSDIDNALVQSHLALIQKQ